jgi:hypothetical protein
MTIFVSYCPQFWGSEVIYKAHDTLYMFERHDRKSSFLCFRVVVMSHCPQFWGSGLIYKIHDTRYMFEGMTKNSSFFHFMAVSVS